MLTAAQLLRAIAKRRLINWELGQKDQLLDQKKSSPDAKLDKKPLCKVKLM
jgi:hypothetical protein